MGLIMEQLAQRGVHNHYSLAYQSRVGPVRITSSCALIITRSLRQGHLALQQGYSLLMQGGVNPATCCKAQADMHPPCMLHFHLGTRL